MFQPVLDAVLKIKKEKMAEKMIGNLLMHLSDTEYADLARHGKVEFRIFCQKHNLPLHFPDVEILDVKKCTKQFPLFFKALSLFNKTNKNRVYVVNGKPIIFTYSFGGLDMEYQAFDSKELLREYLQLKNEQSQLIKNAAFWIVVSGIMLFAAGSLLVGAWIWLILLVLTVLGFWGRDFKTKQKIKNETTEKVEFEKEIALLRTELQNTLNADRTGRS